MLNNAIYRIILVQISVTIVIALLIWILQGQLAAISAFIGARSVF